jgi:hypothetical protein
MAAGGARRRRHKRRHVYEHNHHDQHMHLKYKLRNQTVLKSTFSLFTIVLTESPPTPQDSPSIHLHALTEFSLCQLSLILTEESTTHRRRSVSPSHA